MSPVFKRGWKVNSGNWRPVILTLILGKIMEQVLLKYISGYKKEKVTGNSEHGYTKDRSCLTKPIVFMIKLLDLWVSEEQ